METEAQPRQHRAAGVAVAAPHVLVLVDSDHADTPYDAWAAELGARLTLLVSAEKYPQYAHLPEARPITGYHGGSELERVAMELAGEDFAAVIARGERDVLRAARLRELLGLPGQHWDSALAFRDKVLMKTMLRERGLEVPQFAPVRVALDLFGFIREHGYPVVVKPALGSGSKGTSVLRDEADLTALLADGLPEHAEVERFVDGRMYVVDGLVTEGRLSAVFVSHYLNDCLTFHSGGYLGSAQLTRGEPMVDRLIEYARTVLAALPTPECTTFHLEVFRTPDDRLVLCEVASRTGGARTTGAIRACTGFDLDQRWFAAQLGERIAPDEELRGAAPGASGGWVLFYPGRGRLAALPKDPPSFVVEERIKGTIGHRYHGGEKSGDYLGGYVIIGRDADEIAANAEELAAWYADGISWED
ncbi:acetyl-CoA carboxylase biotin carboxylase subunit family protein [Kitasatospora sp. NPDC017646]|uniref:acetyl-CoA carboxylase biotin carboxylase subunit family protein n=1 Tax=Kitasatospora sp. NPDC017646 TaxID=3364024 RepID=UPI0037AB5EB1